MTRTDRYSMRWLLVIVFLLLLLLFEVRTAAEQGMPISLTVEQNLPTGVFSSVPYSLPGIAFPHLWQAAPP